jgi:NAD(P)H-hydrate epimerase
MQRIDAAAIGALGIPRLLLMDHAGLAVARAVAALVPSSTRLIALCCGTGFNGGDGLSAARHLHGWGYPLRVLLAGPRERLREEPACFARILDRLKVPVRECTSREGAARAVRWLSGASLLVDALLGIGAAGEVREPAASLIRWMNESGKPIVSADVPSGLDADTGDVRGVAVRASVTVTFGLPKRGCRRRQGPAHTGSLVVEPVTFPMQLLTMGHR